MTQQGAQEVNSLPGASQSVVEAYLDQPAVRKRVAIWSAYLHVKELMKRGIQPLLAIILHYKLSITLLRYCFPLLPIQHLCWRSVQLCG